MQSYEINQGKRKKAIKQVVKANVKTCGRFLGLAKLLTGTLKIIMVEFIKFFADSREAQWIFLLYVCKGSRG